MGINWGALGQVFVVGIGATVALVTLFSFGVTGLAARRPATVLGPDDGKTEVGSSTGLAVAILCFGVCALVVAYGVYMIVK